MLVVRGKHYLNNEIYDFLLEDKLIQAIDKPVKGRQTVGGEDYWVAPGLIDIQVNGYDGYHYAPADDSFPTDVVAVAEKLAQAGVTAFCPTLTTNAYASLEESLRAIALACETNELARERILTIHLEGPYISPEDGPRGAHRLEYVRHPDWTEFTKLQAAAGGRIGIITMAPELPNALEFIVKARQAGVLVALGHHAANHNQIEAATAAGASMSTHLGNGAHAQLPRHNNYIWEQLANDALMASIIVDGHHLPPAVVKTIYRTKGPARLILVSDVTAIAGAPPGKYKFMGLEVEVYQDNSVHLAGTPYLAGSTLKLSDAINHVMSFAGATFQEAIGMASTNPAKLLKTSGERGCLRIGARADLTLFRSTLHGLDLAATIIGGKYSYRA